MMHGEIDVERFMEVQARQRRQLERWYLKEHWKAEKDDRAMVVALYGRILEEALAKYRKAKGWRLTT